MRFCRNIALATLLVALPLPAAAWWAWNRHEVYPVSEQAFEVVSRVGSGPQDFWCAAGDFARRVLRVPAPTRVYLWRGVGQSVNRPDRKSVQFALEPPPGADTSTSYSLTIRREGDNLSAALAQQYCYGGEFDPFLLQRRW